MPVVYRCRECGFVLWAGCRDLPTPSEVIARYGGRCPRCGRKLTKPTLRDVRVRVESVKFEPAAVGSRIVSYHGPKLPSSELREAIVEFLALGPEEQLAWIALAELLTKSRKGRGVTVMVPGPLAARLEEVASRLGVTVASVLRAAAVRRLLQKQRPGQGAGEQP